MCKLLTSLALVFAQALPWAGGPLFTCTSGDGSICIDRGPNDCDCCPQTDAEHATCCGDHSASHGHKPCAATHPQAGAAVAPASCDCKHELVASAPVVSALRHASADVDLQVHAWALAASVHRVASLASASAEWSRVAAPDGAAPPVGLLRVIVLRC